MERPYNDVETIQCMKQSNLKLKNLNILLHQVLTCSIQLQVWWLWQTWTWTMDERLFHDGFCRSGKRTYENRKSWWVPILWLELEGTNEACKLGRTDFLRLRVLYTENSCIGKPSNLNIPGWIFWFAADWVGYCNSNVSELWLHHPVPLIEAGTHLQCVCRSYCWR